MKAYRLEAAEPEGPMPVAIEAWGHRFLLVEEWQMVVNRPEPGSKKPSISDQKTLKMAKPMYPVGVRERRIRYARPRRQRHFWLEALVTFCVLFSPFVVYWYVIGSW